MVGTCDVGMIFLDHRFTIPNFPSRLLSYMSAKVPVLAVTDPNTDIGKVVVDGGFGWWCESNNSNRFLYVVQECMNLNLSEMGIRAWEQCEKQYSSNRVYEIISKWCKL